ncbi:DUF4214 domain-containing protein [Allochromatium vinosum]|uniref:DUF4214 domain-containing protein n=1 Tax=Allochromatium vinosum TaxID=1049 RepID=UPI0019049FDE|nr:DUF4214 domain-containing protein [Allochromatium vinosum]
MHELIVIEEQTNMPYITSFERIGRQQGEAQMLLRLIAASLALLVLAFTATATVAAPVAILDWWDTVSTDGRDYRQVANGAMTVEIEAGETVSRIQAPFRYSVDDEGLQYWIDELETNPDWTPLSVAQSFFDQPLVQQEYPADQGYGPLIEALYQNIFGRAADAEGYAYWLEELETGRVSRNQMILALIEGGWANPEASQDMARFDNLIQVGLAFAAAQASLGIVYSELDATTQDTFRQVGRDLLANVTADRATRDAAIAGIAERLADF